MIHSLCLATLSLLPLQDRTDLSRLAPSGTDFLVSVDSQSFDARALHGFVSTLLKSEDGLAALLGSRARQRIQAALDFTQGWPDLPVGQSLEHLAKAGLLFGKVASAPGKASQDPDSLNYLILEFEEPAKAKQASGVLRTWLSLGDRLGQGRDFLNSLEQAGSKLVYARRADLRRGILDRIDGKVSLSKARFSDAFYSGKGGTMMRLRLWADLSQSLYEKNFEKNKNEPLPAMLFSGLFEGLKAAGQYRFRADLSGGARPGLSLRLDLPGFKKGLSQQTLSVWTAGPTWLPARSDDQLLRFAVARDFPSFVNARGSLLSTRGQAELDKFLQGLEFGFQGAQAEKDLLPDLAPGFAGMAALGNEKDRVQEGAISYCLPQGLLAFGHKGQFLAKKVPAALRLFVVAGNANRKRRGQDLYRVGLDSEEGLAMSVAHIATRKVPRPLLASFEPCVASTKTGFYFASTPDLCRSMFKAGERELIPDTDGLVTGNVFEAQGRNLSLALLQNLDLARAQLVLRQGLSYARADKRLRFIARLVEAAGRLEYRDGFRGEDLVLALDWSPGAALFTTGFWNTKRRESLR